MIPMTSFPNIMNQVHDEADLHRIDVNLLVAFDALAREGNVTRAAQRTGVTQSAMSHTLRRLRSLLGDPLLVRGRGGMVLTPRGEALVIPLRAGLRDLARALADPEPFEPARCRRRFRIASPDLFDVLVLPPLLSRLASEAPLVDVAVVPRPVRLDHALETGELDLAIEPRVIEDEPQATTEPALDQLQQRTLFRDSMRCFVGAGHPLAGRRRISLEAYAALDHVLVSPRGTGPGLVDRYLQQQGLRRRVVLRVPHFSSAVAVLARSELVLTAPRSLSRAPLGTELCDFATPLSIPSHAITMVWHPRFAEDPGHRWFRECLREVAQPLSPGPGRRRTQSS